MIGEVLSVLGKIGCRRDWTGLEVLVILVLVRAVLLAVKDEWEVQVGTSYLGSFLAWRFYSILVSVL